MNAAPDRPQRLPHPARLNREVLALLQLNERLHELAVSLARDYEAAYDAALSPRSASQEPPVMGRGHAATDPTGTTATNAQLRQLRWRTAKAARCVRKALGSLEEGLTVLSDGVLLLDDEEFGRWVQKRLAAEGT